MSLTGLRSISWRPKGKKESSTKERCDFGTDPCAATVSQRRYGDRQGYWLMDGKHPGRVGLPESMEAMVADQVAPRTRKDIWGKLRRNNEIRLLKISGETVPQDCP